MFSNKLKLATGSIHDGSDQNLVVLVFRLLNCVIFKMDVINWQLNFGSCKFWSEIILVISNRTRTVRSFDFELAHDFRPNCTPLSSIKIYLLFNHLFVCLFIYFLSGVEVPEYAVF